MKKTKIQVSIDPIQSEGKNISGRVGDIYAFEAIVNKTKGNSGMDNGKVVKLEIYGRFKQHYLLIYNKKWIKKPSKEHLGYYNQVMKSLENGINF